MPLKSLVWKSLCVHGLSVYKRIEISLFYLKISLLNSSSFSNVCKTFFSTCSTTLYRNDEKLLKKHLYITHFKTKSKKNWDSMFWIETVVEIPLYLIVFLWLMIINRIKNACLWCFFSHKTPDIQAGGKAWVESYVVLW